MARLTFGRAQDIERLALYTRPKERRRIPRLFLGWWSGFQEQLLQEIADGETPDPRV